jgi:hypothetical protein
MKRRLLKLWLGIISAVVLLLGGGAGWMWWEQRHALRTSEWTPDLMYTHKRLMVLGGMTCFGKYVTTPQHSPAVIESVKFNCPATIHKGESVVVIAVANQPSVVDEVELILNIFRSGKAGTEDQCTGWDSLYLWDDGTDGDAVAGDGEWYGELICDLPRNVVIRGEVMASFNDDYAPQVAKVENEVRYEATPPGGQRP